MFTAKEPVECFGVVDVDHADVLIDKSFLKGLVVRDRAAAPQIVDIYCQHD